MSHKSQFKALAIIIGCWFASIGYSATILEIDTEKSHVKIDSGKNDSLRKKDRVCFFTPEGKKVACGIIVKLNATQSLVLVSKKSIQKINMKLEAKPIPPEENEASQTPITLTSQMDTNNIKLLYPFTLFSTVSFQKLAYQMPPSTSAKVTSLWKQMGTPSMIVSGLGVEGQFIVKKATVATGIKSIKYSFSSDAYYDSDSRNAAIVNEDASILGLWADYYYLKIDRGFYGITFGNGLEMNKSTIKLKATQTNDDSAAIENQLANGQSNMTLFALRTVGNVHTYVWHMGVSAGMNLLIPLAGTSTFKGDVTSPHVSQIDGIDGNASKPQKDLQRSLSHKKSAFGLELIFSGYYTF